MARFVKGQSGNPGGRPKAIKELKDLAQQHSAEAFNRIVQMMRSEDDRVALAAAQEVLSRGYGRPTQHVEASVKHTFVEALRTLDAIRRTELAAVGASVAEEREQPGPVRH